MCGKGALCWGLEQRPSPWKPPAPPLTHSSQGLPCWGHSPAQQRLPARVSGQGDCRTQKVGVAPPNLCPKGIKVRVGL